MFEFQKDWTVLIIQTMVLLLLNMLNQYSIHIENKEMTQYFLQNMAQVPQGWFGYGPLQPKQSESATIDQLRRENDQLKRQLQIMMRQNQVQAKPIHKNQFMGQPIAFRNSEDDAQRIYKDKLSKLKMKKSSPRHSLQHNQTTPNSPRVNQQDAQRHSFNQTISHNAPHLISPNPRSKITIISKDNHEQYCRQRDVQERINTVRKNNYSQQKMVAVYPKQNMQEGRMNMNGVMPPKPLVVNRMNVNKQVQNVNIYDKTQRKVYVLQNGGQIYRNQIQKCRVFSRQKQRQTHNIKIESTVSRNGSINKNQPFVNNNKNNKLVKAASIQKRNVYVDQNSNSNQQGKPKWKQTKEMGWEDSQLSIQLQQAKYQRKLKYNVYLEQENTN